MKNKTKIAYLGIVQSLVGVRAEVVPLRLDEVGREPLAAIPVVERQRRGEAGGGHAQLDGGGDDLAPGGLAVVDGALEEVVQEEVVQLGVLVEGLLDVAQEDGAEKWKNRLFYYQDFA